MSIVNPYINTTIRIPNLPLGPITDKDGNPTQNEQLFRQGLLDLLQSLMGGEGLVAPTQSPGNVTLIQNATTATVTNIGGVVNVSVVPSCQPGTIIYQQHPTDYTQDELVVAFRNSNDASVVPKFYKVTVT